MRGSTRTSETGSGSGVRFKPTVASNCPCCPCAEIEAVRAEVASPILISGIVPALALTTSVCEGFSSERSSLFIAGLFIVVIGGAMDSIADSLLTRRGRVCCAGTISDAKTRLVEMIPAKSDRRCGLCISIKTDNLRRRT